MKKIAIALAVMLLISALAACGAKKPEPNTSGAPPSVSPAISSDAATLEPEIPVPSPSGDPVSTPAATSKPVPTPALVADADFTDPTPVPTVKPAAAAKPRGTKSPVKNTPAPSPTPSPSPAVSKPTVRPAPDPVIQSDPVFVPMPIPNQTPVLTPMPTQAPAVMFQPESTVTTRPARTICNTCGADITGNVPAHGTEHMLNGENFSYRVE